MPQASSVHPRLFLFVAFVFALGCEGPQSDELSEKYLGANTQSLAIQDIIANAFVLGNVEAAMVVSGFAREMQSREFTAFPPWDYGFERLPYWTKVTRNRAWHGHVRDLLLGHFHEGRIPFDELEDGLEIRMLNGDPARVSMAGNRAKIDGIQVIASTEARDGFLYMLDQVRQPLWANRTALDIIDSDSRFSILSDILRHPSLSAERQELGSSSAELTFFAPTDIALAGFDIGQCDETDCSDLLRALVGNHVATAVVARDFAPTQTLAALSGRSLEWDSPGQTVSCTHPDGTLQSDGLDAFDEELAINGVVQPINDVLCTVINLCDTVDSDGDGTNDCDDACPDDASKTTPGSCGCGVADADSDSDGVPDCNDGCPGDAAKTGAGLCGCGIPDDDADGDGVVECEDEDLICARLGDDVDLSKEPLANRYCCLCEGCDLPPEERYYRYVDSNQTTCLGLEFDMFDMEPNSGVCLETKREYRELCCNAECTPPPAIEQQWGPVQVPLPFGPGPYSECDLCKNGQYPLKPNTRTAIAGVPGNPTCADLYWMGRTDNIPAAMCYPIQNFMEEGCGCLPPPPEEVPRGDEPRCDICPDGQFPLRRGALFNDLPGNPSCNELYWEGRAGSVTPDVCQQVQTAPGDPCGCFPEPAE